MADPLGGTDVSDRTCTADDCTRTDIAGRGLCRKHYQRWRIALVQSGERPAEPCGEIDCDQPAQSRKMCRRHYNAWYHNTRATEVPCKQNDCVEKSHARGYCSRHYYRHMRGL